jgi:hypothetical protein
MLAARRARALGVGLLSGGYGQNELETQVPTVSTMILQDFSGTWTRSASEAQSNEIALSSAAVLGTGSLEPASRIATIPVRNTPSKVPAPPIEATGAPRSAIRFRLLLDNLEQ